MRPCRYRRQLFNRRGVSEVFVYLILLLIALFSGFIVRFMAGSLIEEYVNSTLGLRLLLHGLTLSYNSAYSLPTGYTDFATTVPAQCSLQCVDCNSTIIWFPVPYRVVSCECNDFDEYENPLPALDPLLDVEPNEKRLVCDDYVINTIDPVMLFDGVTPLSAAIRVTVQLYPESSLIWSFKDVISDLVESEAFDRELTIFSEMPVNLNDYATVRRLLTSASFIDFSNLISWDGNVTMRLNRRSYDEYDSLVGSVNYVQGLQGLVDKVFLYTSNQSIGSNDPLNYYLRTNDDSWGVLNLPSEPFNFILKPGLKIVKTADKTLCEYACYRQNTLEAECDGDWYLVSCFDFATIEGAVCDNCSANEFTYYLNVPDEVLGAVRVDYEAFTYMDIFTGREALVSENSFEFNDFTEESFLTDNSELDGYSCTLAGACHKCTYSTGLGYFADACPVPGVGETLNSDLPATCYTCTAQVSESIPWPLSDDCSLRALCTDEGVLIQVSDNLDNTVFNYCDYEDLFVDGLCKLGNKLVIEEFKECDASGNYYFDNDDLSRVLSLRDKPSTTLLKAVLSSYGVNDNYQVTPFGCERVTLESIGAGAIHSKMALAGSEGINDVVYSLTLSKTGFDFNINLEAVE
ncbi:MAG: hypothetical protein WC307_04020 [Candidatus Nanoarchaeia archaeon]